jgi:hypothetical protein
MDGIDRAFEARRRTTDGYEQRREQQRAPQPAAGFNSSRSMRLTVDWVTPKGSAAGACLMPRSGPTSGNVKANEQGSSGRIQHGQAYALPGVVFNELALDERTACRRSEPPKSEQVRDARFLAGRMYEIERVVGQGPGGAAVETIRFEPDSVPGTMRSGNRYARGNEGVGEHVRTRFHAGPFGTGRNCG